MPLPPPAPQFGLPQQQTYAHPAPTYGQQSTGQYPIYDPRSQQGTYAPQTPINFDPSLTQQFDIRYVDPRWAGDLTREGYTQRISPEDLARYPGLQQYADRDMPINTNIFWRLGGVDASQMQQQLLGQYQSAYNESLQANQQRYQDILGGYRDRYGEAMGQLEGLGEAQRTELQRQHVGAESRGMQDLTTRGLTGTTVLPTMRMGYQREYDRAQQELEEGLRRERLGYQTGLSGDVLRFMERRTDKYPSIEQMTQLAMSMGEGQGGGTVTPRVPAGASDQTGTTAVPQYPLDYYGGDTPYQAWQQMRDAALQTSGYGGTTGEGTTGGGGGGGTAGGRYGRTPGGGITPGTQQEYQAWQQFKQSQEPGPENETPEQKTEREAGQWDAWFREWDRRGWGTLGEEELTEVESLYEQYRQETGASRDPFQYGTDDPEFQKWLERRGKKRETRQQSGPMSRPETGGWELVSRTPTRRGNPRYHYERWV